jgi:hypothetical protein
VKKKVKLVVKNLVKELKSTRKNITCDNFLFNVACLGKNVSLVGITGKKNTFSSGHDFILLLKENKTGRNNNTTP